MRDIIETLRDSQPENTQGGLLLNDAADEILRLRQRLQQTQSALSNLMDMMSDMPADPEECFGTAWRSAREALKGEIE